MKAIVEKRKRQEREKERRLFAAMAMQAIVSTLTISRGEHGKFIAESAVKYADALIAQLDKGEQ